MRLFSFLIFSSSSIPLFSTPQVHEEFKQNVENIGIDNLIQKFAEQKGTGKDKPGTACSPEGHNITQNTHEKHKHDHVCVFWKCVFLQLSSVLRSTWQHWHLKVGRRVGQKPSGFLAWVRGTRSQTQRECTRKTQCLQSSLEFQV